MANSELNRFLAAEDASTAAHRHSSVKSPSLSTTSAQSSESTQSRARWKILSAAVKSKQFNRTTSTTDSVYEPSSTSSGSDASSSVPQTPELSESSSGDHSLSLLTNGSSLVQAYNLMTYAHLDSTWITCTWNPVLLQSPLELFFKFVPPSLTVQDLAGFDNSGNVRVWPCEELLAYLLYGPLQQRIRKTRILELGAGMTALAGLVAIALDMGPEIHLTDGNERCVANIGEVVRRNFPWTLEFDVPKVTVSRLRWEMPADYSHLSGRIETIIAADCLFVRRHHRDLLNTIDRLLVPSDSHRKGDATAPGTVYIIAPARGKTMHEFTDLLKADNRYQFWQYEQFDQLFSEWTANGGAITAEVPYLIVIRRKGSPSFKL